MGEQAASLGNLLISTLLRLVKTQFVTSARDGAEVEAGRGTEVVLLYEFLPMTGSLLRTKQYN
jgi:hypothetical protein